MTPTLFLLLIYVGPGVAAFGAECLIFRVTRRRFRALRLLPAALLAIPAARMWEIWRYGGPFKNLALVGGGAVILSMALGLVLGCWIGFRWAKRS